MRPLPSFLAFALLAASSTVVLAQTSYPLTLENCGETVTLAAAPQRVVTIKSTTTEMLLALGLGERIVGIGFMDGPVPEPWAAQAATLPVLADKAPSPEVVLEAEPDLVYAGWESNFSADGAGERATLAALGVASYVSPPACRSIKPPKLTFEAVFNEIAEIGTMFDAAPAAEALIAEQRAALAAIVPDMRGLTALWYSSASKTPYVGAGSNAPQMMLEALGLENIMAGVDEGWVSVSWEAVVDANPDVIVLVDSIGNPAARKQEFLAENPITSKLDAVAHQRYLIVPFPAAEAGVRNVGATADMAAQLARLSFTP
ncbi:putative F420-0 ABC transporter substrate-binding protein [Devosia sp. A449]